MINNNLLTYILDRLKFAKSRAWRLRPLPTHISLTTFMAVDSPLIFPSAPPNGGLLIVLSVSLGHNCTSVPITYYKAQDSFFPACRLRLGVSCNDQQTTLYFSYVVLIVNIKDSDFCQFFSPTDISPAILSREGSWSPAGLYKRAAIPRRILRSEHWCVVARLAGWYLTNCT